MTQAKRAKLGIKEVHLRATNKRGKVTESHLTYNQKGRILSSKSPTYERMSTYFNDTLESTRLTNRKGKTTEFKINYTPNGKILDEEKYRNGKTISVVHNTYLNNHIVSPEEVYKGKKSALKNTYNESGDLTKTVYFKNGKIKKSWVYECKPEGELYASVKTEIISSSCEYKAESADGSYSVYTRTIREGKPYLVQETFSKDSVKTSIKRFENDSIMTYSWIRNSNSVTEQHFINGKLKRVETWNYDENNHLVSKEFLKKNKLRKTYKFQYDSNGNQTRFEKFKGANKKLSYTTIRSYDAMGNNISVETSRKKDGEIQYKTEKKFNPDGSLSSEAQFKKGKLTSKREFQYVKP